MVPLLDCSLIRDEDLRQNTLGVWAQPLQIAYSFSGLLARRQQRSLQKDGLQAARHVSEVFQAHIRAALQQWQALANGLIRFVEKPSLANNEPGIVLSTCGSIEQFFKENMLGITYYWRDGDYLSRAIACFPEGFVEQASHESNRTALHEIGHALGADHMHNIARMRQALKMTRGGKLCSVMPYPFEIDSPVSTCHVDVCIPPYATRLGPLDRRWLQQAYGDVAQLDRQGANFSVALSRWSPMPPLGVALACVLLVLVASRFFKRKLMRRQRDSRHIDAVTAVTLGAIDLAAVILLAISMGGSVQLLQVALVTVLLKTLSLLLAARARPNSLVSRGLVEECLSMPMLAAMLVGQHHSFGSVSYKAAVAIAAFLVGVSGHLGAECLMRRSSRDDHRAPVLPI